MRIYNSRKGACNDHSLDRRCMYLDGPQDAGRAIDRWIKEIFLHIRDIKVEWAGGVDDGFKGRTRPHGLIESPHWFYVRHNGKVKLIFRHIGICFSNAIGLLVGADRSHHRVFVGEEDFKNVRSDEAGATGEKYAGHGMICFIYIQLQDRERSTGRSLGDIYRPRRVAPIFAPNGDNVSSLSHE